VKQNNLLSHFFKELLQIFMLMTLLGIALSFMLATPLRRSLSFSLAIGLNIFLMAWILAWMREDKRKTVGIFAIAVPLGSIVGVVLGTHLLGGSPLQFLEQEPQALITTSVSAILFGTAISYYFYARSRIAESQHRLQVESLNRVQIEQELTETELRLLQAQIEPHFLFNTLSNIIGLIDPKPHQAKKMLEDFTHYLRASLQRTRRQKSTLAQEVGLLKAYLSIQSVRMGERLNYHFDLPDDLEKIALPPLMIQPLVENAIKHGLESSLEGGSINIKVCCEDDQLVIEVCDTGRGLKAQDDLGSGFGLDNIRRRLNVLYGEKSTLHLSENPPQGVKACLRLPLQRVEKKQ